MFNDYGYTEDVISLYICIDMLFNNVPFCYSLFIYLNNSITIHYCFGFIFQINISSFFYFASVPNCEPLNLSLKPYHTKKKPLSDIAIIMQTMAVSFLRPADYTIINWHMENWYGP